ncbi:Bromodomain and WD repeat-containing protein 1 [Phytophthora nicotianae]|uniref:Bromodomain and WD repeat-containing protein 1 n=1 Tax=Phytophthora nicotianae TaxID=4792 RepID=A0A0W8DJU9_PHYNI|nr:Bromodomain and WD repeat-containing protein 1 [Phytophthora nicotianae]
MKKDITKTALTCSMYYNVKKISAIKEKFTFSGAAQWPEHLNWVVTDDLVDTKGIDPAKHWLTQSPSADSTAFLQYTSGSTSAPKASKSDRLTVGLASGQHVDLSSVRHMINGAEPIQGEAIDNFYRAFSPFGLPEGVVKPTYGLAEHTVYVCGGGQQRLWVDKQELESNRVFRVVEKTNTAGLVKEMIGCGVPSRKDYGIDVRIVDAETEEEKPEGETGEIWISSASKARGYYGDEMREFSAEAFQAKVVGDTEGKTFLKTGDLGVIYNQELFICGRMKDLVIIRGRNHYPQDLEASAESHEELRPGCCAAFSYLADGNADDEQLAVVAELRDPAMTSKASLCGKIRSAIAREHGVKVTLVVLLAPRSIPKTTSGKISRSRCKKALEEKTLEELYRNEDMIADVPVEDDGGDVAVAGETMNRNVNGPRVASTDDGSKSNLPSVITGVPPDQVHAFLVEELARTLGVEPTQINDDTPLQELGLDSMALTQLQGVIAQKYQVHVEEELLYGETTTLASLHAGLCGETSGNRTGGTSASAPKQKLFCGCIAC